MLELTLFKNGKVRVTLHSPDGDEQNLATSTDIKSVISLESASIAWNRSFYQILHLATVCEEVEGKDEVLHLAFQGIMQLFQWISDFCGLAEVCLKQSRNVVMADVAKRSTAFLRKKVFKGPSEVQNFTHFFLGTALLTGLCLQWPKEKWSRDTLRKNAMEAFVQSFGQLLSEGKPEALCSAISLHIGSQALEALWNQLEEVLKLPEIEDLPHRSLLKVVVATSQKLQRELPLHSKSRMNLEYLLGKCVVQHNRLKPSETDATSLESQLAPLMGQAAMSSRDPPVRLAESVVYLCKQLDISTCARILCIAHDACSDKLQCGAVIQELCRKSLHLQKCIILKTGGPSRAAKDIFQELFRPLLTMPKISSMDLQQALSSVIGQQIAKYWTTADLFRCLQDFWNRLCAETLDAVDDGKRGFLLNFHSQVAIQEALKVAWSTQSSLSSLRPVAVMEAMMQVASTWMKADVLCDLSLWVMKRPQTQSPSTSLFGLRLSLDVWQQLMSATATSSQFELLLAAAINSMLPESAQTYQFLRMIQETIPSKDAELRRQAGEAVAAMKPRSLALRDIVGSDGAGKSLDWLSSLILEHWIPSVAAVPPNSQQEEEFLKWLSASDPIFAPQLIGARLQSRGMMLHPWLIEVPCDPKWAQEWPVLENCPWPKLEQLVASLVATGLSEAELPSSLTFFVKFYRAAANGYLPRKAYTRLAEVCQRPAGTLLFTLVENMALALRIADLPAMLPLQLFPTLGSKAEELKMELHRQMQLLEWLVAKWGFQEIARPRAEMKKTLREVDDLPLMELEREVQSSCEIFQCLDQYDKGQEMFDFLQHFMRSGSALVKPLLEHCASVYAKQQGQWSQDDLTSLDFHGFCQVVGLCHRDLGMLAAGTHPINMQVWQLLVTEFLQKNTDMRREINLLLGYFLQSAPPDKARLRQQLLVDAFRVHRIAATLPDLLKALQLMKFDWALECRVLQQLSVMVADLGTKQQVNVVEDAAKLQRVRELGISDELNLQLFETLLQRVCVYDFFVERGFIGPECMTRFQETLSIVQQSLEQDEIAVRQALLDELRYCAEVLRPFLTQRGISSEGAVAVEDTRLLGILQSLARQVRLEALDTVAENLKLIGALFDSVQGTGSQLLLFSLKKILEGDLVLMAPEGGFACTYKGARGEEVVVPSSSLSEYSVRSLMSLEGRDPDSDEAKCLKNYIRQMEAIVARDGLAGSSLVLHHVGHPGYRKLLRIPMTMQLHQKAREQQELLERWKEDVEKMLRVAPILGLVPRGQLHAWLAEIQNGLRPKLLRSLADGLSIWNSRCTEDHISTRLRGSELQGCCQGLKVQTQQPAKAGRFVIREELTEEQVLLVVVQLFLQWIGGPGRLPRPSEVLFCSKGLAVAEVEAFLWRSKQFPELLFVLVEPNHLAFEAKTLVADWLAQSEDDGSAVVVILTAPWHIPSSSHVQRLNMKPEKSVVSKWKQESTTELMICSSAPPPRGAGVSSGKSTAIQKHAKEASRQLVPCILHEGFQLPDFVSEVRTAMESGAGPLALHIDLSAYSDPSLAGFILRHIFLCGVLYDPTTGETVYIPVGTRIYVEVGAIAGKRDIHSLKAYVTEESLQAKFPKVKPHELDLSLLYPILQLLGQQMSSEVQRAEFHTDEEDLTLSLRLIQASFPWEARQLQLHPAGYEGLDLRRALPQPAAAVLAQLARRSGVVGELIRSRQKLMGRRISILSNWMVHCPLFTLQDAETAAQLGFLLMECMVMNLCQLHMGEEPCIHFVPTYTKTQQDHFCLFFPSLMHVDGGSTCSRGSDCGCNDVRRELQRAFPGQVWISEAPLAPTLQLALEDEHQGIQALSCAFGIQLPRLQEILRLEGYILTRDFACKILELLARRKSRAPVILVGESGVGKTRALEMMTRLLLESDEVRPPIPQSLFSYMRAKLVQKKDQVRAVAGVYVLQVLEDGISRVEKAMNDLLEEGFTLQGFKELLAKGVLYEDLGDQEALFTRKELTQYLVTSVQGSPRFEIGLLHLLLQSISVDDDSDAIHRACARVQGQWDALESTKREMERSKDSLAMICHLVGDEVHLSGMMDEIDLTEEDTTDVGDATLQLTLKVVALLPPQPMFFRVQVHAAMTAQDIHQHLEPAFAACQREPNLTIVVFLDEVNTASCLGLIKAMLFDGIYGRYQNLFIVAAANPYREETTGVDQVLRGGDQVDQVMRDFFQVHPLPPSFNSDIWNWRSPTAVDEECYAMLQLKRLEDLSDADVTGFARAIADAQRFMRQQLSSESAVSQRDIIRVIRLLEFFGRRRHGLQSISDRAHRARAMLLAFGVCYYLGLNSTQRKLFNEQVARRAFSSLAMEERCGTLDLPVVLHEEMDLYMKHVVLPPSIALTRALKENVFSVIVGIECRIPVIIVGMPGTGKTLAVNIATSVLRGSNSMPFFRDFCDVANSVFRYQCSKESTSRQIHEVFENALRAKKRMDLEQESRRCPVVFIDEAGLPEERTESLKAIHYWIDRGEIFCCLLANRPLDAAKRNRCLQVFRDEADGHDLQLLASECLGVQLQDPSSRALVQGFCGAFEEISRGNSASALKIFHLRDFHHCLRYLRRKGLVQSGGVAGKDILRSLQRNFGGLPADDFRELVKIFFKHLGAATEGLICAPAESDFQPTIDVLQEALQDLPPEPLTDADFEPCRYKLLIDATEDGGALRVLQSLQMIPEGVSVLGASSLEGEQGQLHRSKTVSSLRRAAEQPKICVVSDFDEMLDGFYDMLNLRFQRINLKDRIGFAATIAAGSYSILAPVHPRFQLLVCIKASDVKQMPLPFLNRFEKYFLGPRDLACHRAFELCNGRLQHHFLEEYLLQPCRGRLEDLVQLLGAASLVGCTEATIDSACCDAMQSPETAEVLATLAATWQEVQEPSVAKTDVEMLEASDERRHPLELQLHRAVSAIASSAATRLLQLAPSEAVLCHVTSLPRELKQSYTQRPHTGLGSLLEHLRAGDKRRCLIFTRDTLQTPTACGGLLCTKEFSRDDVKIKEMPQSREEALEMFEAQKTASQQGLSKPLMILCRLDSGTQRAIHHVRRIADECDVELVMTVLLPPWRLHVSLCYEAVFLGHWTIFHLDSLDDSESPNLVSSILCPEEKRMETEISSGDEDALHQDCWAATARLPLTEIPSRGRESMPMAGVAMFYSPYASLPERVEALWSALKQPEMQPLLDQLLRLRSCALQGVSLQREAVRVAQEIVGIAGEKRPMTCLQSTVRQRCAEQVVTALVEALHALCDQGGLITLIEQGDPAVALTAAYLKLRVAEANRKEAARPLSPFSGTSAMLPLPCFQQIFNMLQESVHSNAPEDFDLVQLVESTGGAWSKHAFFGISQALLAAPIWQSYCDYVARRFGFPPVVAQVLQSVVQPLEEMKRLPAMHAFAWCHRSDLAALGFLYQDDLPIEIRARLQRPNHQGALLGDGLAACMISLAEEKLKVINKKKYQDSELVTKLNSWHQSFESLRATLSGRLPLPSSSRDKLQLLAYFSDLIPFLIDGCGMKLLDQLMYQVFSGQVGERLALQKASLKGIASLANDHLQQQQDVTPLRSTLQRLLDDIMGPLQLERVSNLETQFQNIAELLVEVVDPQAGFFQSSIVTPAMAASALTSLLEVVKRHGDARPQLMNILNSIVTARAAGSSAWSDFWGPLAGGLPQFLYFAFRSPHLRELLVPSASAVLDFTERICSGSSDAGGNQILAGAFAAAQQQLLLEAVVQQVAKSLTPGEARQLAPALEALAGEDVLLAFFDELVQQIGSATASGKAVKELVSKAGGGFSHLEAWSDSLLKPELAARGPGEDPWNDLPRASLPGFEGEQERRKGQDGERQRQDQLLLASQNSRRCPRCHRVIQKSTGCDVMQCGRHAHTNDKNAPHQEGCGHSFNWSQAPVFQPSLEESRPPPGFSAISSWLETWTGTDLLSAACGDAAREALRDLSEWDRRYAVANAVACRYFKQDQRHPALGSALLCPEGHALRAAMALEDLRMARLVAVLCDAEALPKSQSLASAALLGKDCWEESSNSTSSPSKLRHALVNLLVTVVGCPDNNHLWMLLLEPCSMLNSYPVGFIYGEMPGPEGYHFDCGCVLDHHGRMPRVRAPLENTHLHFLNFCSWAVLSLGLLIFPENCQGIDQILSLRYVQELAPLAPGSSDAAEMVRSYAMNFAVRCFECVCLHQGLSSDDRGLCFSKVFELFRLRACGGDDDDIARCFRTAEQRRRYEEMWKETIDQVLSDLPRLQKKSLEVSETQGHLLQLQEFREKKNYMQRFFHSFETCTLALPAEADLAFISLLLTRQDELVHLPLLGQIVQLSNWIYDRLNGCLPVDCLEMPLIELLQRRQRKDEERGHHSNARRCQTVQLAFKKFLRSWHQFYEANRGEIPVECQAGRQQVGLEAQQTHLAKIEDGSLLPLRFFLSFDTKCQPLMVAEYLCRCWNEIVDAAGSALRLSKSRCATSWATQIEGSVPVWLADLFIQEQLAHTLNRMTLRRAVLRNLYDGSSVAPRIHWMAAQQEILSSHWVHRIQKLDFPQLPQFLPKRGEDLDVPMRGEDLAALSEDLQEKIRDSFAQMSPEDLAKCRAALTRISSLIETRKTAGSLPESLLEVEEVRYQVESTNQLKDLLEGLSVAALPCLRRLAEEESGEFRHLSPVLKAPLPEALNLKEIMRRDWGDLRTLSTASLSDKDKLLREAISNLESEHFCRYLMDHDSKSLATTYETVYMDRGCLDLLPASVLGCHAVAVLQCLRELLRDVRSWKSSLDEQSVWDPRAGLQPLPRSIFETQQCSLAHGAREASQDQSMAGTETMEEDWWEIVPESEAAEDESEPVNSSMQNPELMLSFMVKVCSDPEGAQAADANLFQMLSQCQGGDLESGGLLQGVDALDKFLDIYERQLSCREKSSAWQEALGSRIQLRPLETLLSLPVCQTLELQDVSEMLWSSEASPKVCLYPSIWRRFVQGLARCGHSKLEAAVNQVAATALPLVLRVPSLAEKEATHQKHEVLLNYEGHYFQVLPLRDSPDPPSPGVAATAASGGWAWLRSLRFWGTKGKKDTEAAAQQKAAPPKKRRRITAAAVAAAVKRRAKREEEQRTEDRKRLKGEAQSRTEEAAPPSSVVSDRVQLCREDFHPLHGTLPEFCPKVKCSESFHAAMRSFLPDEPEKADALRQELRNLVHRLVQSMGPSPFGLEKEELFALVAFGFDIRQKFPEASRQLDFSTNLRRCVRERDRKRLEELGALMHHLMKGLAKRKTPIDGLLYSVICDAVPTMKVAQTVELPTFTSWRKADDELIEGSTKVTLRTKTGACDLSEILQSCNLPNHPEMVLLPSTMLRVVKHSNSLLELEEVTDGEDDF